jgi:ParB-like chromosome segregation protein Spo0J
MHMEELDPARIDLGDDRFRISEALDVPELDRSLREIGQLNPVMLEPGAGGFLLPVAGFRRLRALRRVGAPTVLARVLPPDLAPLQAFRVALWDNLSHRQLTPLEKARALHVLKTICGVPHDDLVRVYLPILGLTAHKNVMRTHLALNGLVEGLRKLVRQDRLTLASAERLAFLPSGEQEKLAPVLGAIRLSASLQRQVLDLAGELAASAGCSAAAIFDSPDILRHSSDPQLSPFQRGELVHEALHSRRNPTLSRVRERFAAAAKELGIPGEVRLSPEPFFETPRVRIEFDVTSAERFRDLVSILQRAAEHPAMEKLFDVRQLTENAGGIVSPSP